MEGEREGEKHQCVVASCAAPTRDPPHNSGMCPDWDLNRRPFGSQAVTPSSEPHQPGLNSFIMLTFNKTNLESYIHIKQQIFLIPFVLTLRKLVCKTIEGSGTLS